ncbi:MAG: hypothetical protein JSR26_05190 [Proteobacteria bacterium]|nr:hypothetical protein [Pseudomonadota bacterium]
MTVQSPTGSPAAICSPGTTLLERHGELMDAVALMAFFKFANARSFRRSAGSGALPVSVFRIPGRKGWFARTADVVLWIARQGGGHEGHP